MTLLKIHNLQKQTGTRIKCFGHAGDGNLHAYILKDDMTDEQWKKALAVTMGKMYQKARTLKGSVSGEHGIGYAKKEYLKQFYASRSLQIMPRHKKGI